MNVTETKSEGLSREYRVSIPKGELAAKLSSMSHVGVSPGTRAARWSWNAAER